VTGEEEDFHAQASSAGKRKQSSATSNPQQVTVKLSDPNAKMDKDFVVSISTVENQEPTQRSRALLSPSTKYGHSALMVTINLRPSSKARIAMFDTANILGKQGHSHSVWSFRQTAGC